MSNNPEKAAQMAAAVAGAALAYYGLKKGGLTGVIASVMGAGMTTATVTSAAGKRSASASGREVRQAVEVRASRQDAYSAWSEFEHFPRFMADVREVRKTGDGTYHWTVEGPLGQRVEWDVEVTANEPGRRVAWRSTTADIPDSGEVRFEPTEYGTRVLVTMRYGRPAGPIGALVARITGSNPNALVSRDLRRFKQLIEADEISQPSQRNQIEKNGLTEAVT